MLLETFAMFPSLDAMAASLSAMLSVLFPTLAQFRKKESHFFIQSKSLKLLTLFAYSCLFNQKPKQTYIQSFNVAYYIHNGSIVVFNCRLVLIVKINGFFVSSYITYFDSVNLGKKETNSKHEQLLERWLYFFLPDECHVQIRPVFLSFCGSYVSTTQFQ